MEYAAILLLLKKRRRPVRSVDEGLKSVLAIVQPGTGTENGEINPQRPHRRKVHSWGRGINRKKYFKITSKILARRPRLRVRAQAGPL